MSRVLRGLAAAIALAGGGFAAATGDAGAWLADGATAFIDAAARGAAAPLAERPRPKGVVDAGRPHQALSIRPELNIAVSDPGLAEARQPRAGAAGAALATISPVAPRPVELRVAQVGAQQPGTARDDAPAWDTTSLSHRALVQAIQKELHRVGCYQGGIDGDWDGNTRKAMKAFNDRVNASLPVAQPDVILLMLVQGHAAKACGATCPAGQDEARDGSCQPRSVLAEARRKAAASISPVAPETSELPRKSDNEAPLQGERARARPDDPRVGRERDQIAAVEERKRQRAVEAKAQADAERASRMADLERAWATADARRREEVTARSALGAGSLPQSSEPQAPKDMQSALPTAQAGPLSPPGQSTLVELPPASDRSATHVLTRPANARFVGPFIPPPSYRVGRLPPLPGTQTRPSTNKAQPPSPGAGSGARLQVIFKSVDRHSP